MRVFFVSKMRRYLFFSALIFFWLYLPQSLKEGRFPLGDFSEIAAQVKPAVVNITTYTVVDPLNMKDNFWDFFFPEGERDGLRRAAGSGFIVSPAGYIITNSHVVRQADKIMVRLADKSQFVAKVVGRDEATDIALIKISAKRRLPTVRLGDSDKIKVGEWVIAIGNPGGLEHTVTVGVVSAKERNLGSPNTAFRSYIQTDAAINFGNSGGPLINIRGEVIGINTLILANSENLGFAIPMNTARRVITELIAKGRVDYGYLGVYPQEITPELALGLGLSVNQGALVGMVEAGSAAKKAGVRRGDVIISFNKKKISSPAELYPAVASTSPGKKVPLVVLRGKKRLTLFAVVKRSPQSTRVELTEEERRRADEPPLGIEVTEPGENLARRFGRKVEGVIISRIHPLSKAAEAGLAKGNLIREVNGVKVAGVKDYKRELKKPIRGKVVVFYISSVDAYGSVLSRYVAVRVE
jgi:serine protease Do